ncbi:MAG TPA: tetratricopeptide repeat protein [Pyrinomonadaceae bacterium]|jgi:tetratricopeptide (TPR) repeat protein|nr:tetratricopeptide repeat protein [Pyrinomonadaceae bacterium]
MSKNILFCALGIILGFFLGFFIINAITRPGAQVSAARASTGGVAVPLKPEQMNGQLPPGHPDIAGAAGDAPASTAASTSAEAQAAMDKADRGPKDFDAQAQAGRVFYGLQDYDKAALYLSRALAIKGNDFDTLALLGDVKYDAQDFASAATLYERALAIKPGSPDVRTDLGNTYFNRKDYDRAIAEYRKSIAIDPNHLNSWKNIAAAALQKGDRATATEAVSKLSQLDPQSPETQAYRQKLAEMP